MRRIWKRLPLQFRVLYRQFLLRVIDLESLSIHADIPRFLAQFASALIFISIIAAAGPIFFHDNARTTPEAFLQFTWKSEQSLISGMMLVIGLIAVTCWDSTFPDRRDALVLSPLPIKPRTVLFAKVAALASLLGIALLTLNFATGVVWPLILGAQRGSIWRVFQSFAAYWFTMIACSGFLSCCVLSVQGLYGVSITAQGVPASFGGPANCCIWYFPLRLFFATIPV